MIDDQKNAPSILPLLVGAASFIIIVAGMKSAASILNSFLLSLMIAITITPLLRWLEKKRIPPILALLIVILIVVIVGGTLIAFLGISISQLLQTLPTYENNLTELKNTIDSFLTAKRIEVADIFGLDIFNPSRLIETTATFLKAIAQGLSSSLLLIFIVIFMLLESSGFPLKLQQGLAENRETFQQFNDFNQSIRSYIFITAWTGAVTALIDAVWLSLLGIDLVLLWTVLFFLLNFIPAVGFLLAIIPPLLLALLEFGGKKALLVFISCWLVDNIMDKFIKPRYMKEGLDLSPLVIILSIIFWSWVLGPTGALLAVPLTLMIKKFVLENTKETRLLALLMEADVQEVKSQKSEIRS